MLRTEVLFPTLLSVSDIAILLVTQVCNLEIPAFKWDGYRDQSLSDMSLLPSLPANSPNPILYVTSG